VSGFASVSGSGSLIISLKRLLNYSPNKMAGESAEPSSGAAILLLKGLCAARQHNGGSRFATGLIG
jgi:hypothetical protein